MLALLALAVWMLCCDRGGGAAGGARDDGGTAKRFKIAVIPKGTTHEFWKSVHAGAVKASRELAVDIVWKGPMKEDDLKNRLATEIKSFKSTWSA